MTDITETARRRNNEVIKLELCSVPDHLNYRRFTRMSHAKHTSKPRNWTKADAGQGISQRDGNYGNEWTHAQAPVASYKGDSAQNVRNNSGSFVTLAVIRRASSRVNNLAAVRPPSRKTNTARQAKR